MYDPLALPPKCWGYRPESPYLAKAWFWPRVSPPSVPLSVWDLKFSRRFLGLLMIEIYSWAKGRVGWCLVLSCSGFLPHAHSGCFCCIGRQILALHGWVFSSLQVHMWYSARTHITTGSSDPSKEEWPCLVYCRWNLEGGLQESTRISKSKSCLGLEYLDKKRSEKKATPTRLGSAAPPFTLSAVSCVGCFWWSALKYWGGSLLPSSPAGSLHPPVPLCLLCSVTLWEGASQILCLFVFSP